MRHLGMNIRPLECLRDEGPCRPSQLPTFRRSQAQAGAVRDELQLRIVRINCPTTYRATWEHTLAIAQRADRIGFEILVPIARWRGFGGTTDFNGTAFETYTWATGLLALTKRIVICATSHVPMIHPIVAAKQCVNSGSYFRWALRPQRRDGMVHARSRDVRLPANGARRSLPLRA